MQRSFVSKYRHVILLFLPLAYVSIGTMTSIYSDFIPYRDWIRLLLALIGSMSLFVNYNQIIKQPSRLFIVLFFLLSVILLSNTFNLLGSSNIIAHDVLDMGDSVLWIAILFLAYRISLNHSNTLLHSSIIGWVAPVFTYVFMNIRMYYLANPDLDTAMRSTAYYALFLLPFVLLQKNNISKWILTIIVFISILLSVKRAGFVAFIGALLIYFYVYIKHSKHNFSKFQRFIGFIVFAYLIYLFSQFFIEQNDLSIIERLSAIEDDGGSGRDMIWAHTWKMIEDSPLQNLIIGHGYNTVIRDSQLGFSAHTDTLEIIYDYGLLGTVLYLLFYVKLFSYYKKLIYIDISYAASFAASLVLTFTLSMFAHLLIYPTHFLFVCMFWGFCIGECERQQYYAYGISR